MKRKTILIIVVILLIVGLITMGILVYQSSALHRSHVLMTAIAEGDETTVERLIKKSPELVNYVEKRTWYNAFTETTVYTPLQGALIHCKTDIAKILIENGADVNFVNPYTRLTSLLSLRYSLSRDSEYQRQAVEMLLDNGADKTVTDDNGGSAYDFAVEMGYEWAQLLKP